MKKYILNNAMITTVLFSACINSNAQVIDSHVHGLSELTIAIENKTLEIEIISPSINLVGFEHKAKTKRDIATVKKVIKQLNNQNNVIYFSGGNCLLIDKSIDVSSIIDEHYLKNKTHNNHDEHQHENHANHYDIVSYYHYHCEKASTLTTITVNMFDHFLGINQIAARWVTEQQQGSKTLSPTKNIIKLR